MVTVYSESVMPRVTYKLNLVLHPDKMSFNGTVFVIFHEKISEAFVIMNVADSIKIKSVRQQGNILPCGINQEMHLLQIQSDDFMAFPIAITYEGSLGNDKEGLYCDENGTIACQFYFNNLSKLIPCFDDLENAKFLLNVATSRGTVVASSALTGSQIILGDTQFKFAETEFIQSRCIGLAVTQYERVERGSLHFYGIYESLIDSLTPIYDYIGVLFGTVHSGPVSIIAVEQYPVEVPSPLGIIFVPSGIMENVTECVLYLLKQLVNQWIGCRMMINDYSKMWIFEGLATYLSYFLYAQVFGDSKIWDHFVTKHFVSVLVDDTSSGVPPLSRELDEICADEVFDPLTISKAACLFRMSLENSGIDTIKDFVMQCTGSFVDEETICDVFGAWMNDWMESPCYPVVAIDIDEMFVLQQARFATSPRGFDVTWSIPIEIVYSERGETKTQKVMLSEEMLEISVDKENVDWIVVNPECKSLCRVLYKGNLRCYVKKCDCLGEIDKALITYNFRSFKDMGLISAAALKEMEFESELLPKFRTRVMPLIRGNGSAIADLSEL